MSYAMSYIIIFTFIFSAIFLIRTIWKSYKNWEKEILGYFRDDLYRLGESSSDDAFLIRIIGGVKKKWNKRMFFRMVFRIRGFTGMRIPGHSSFDFKHFIVSLEHASELLLSRRKGEESFNTFLVDMEQGKVDIGSLETWETPELSSFISDLEENDFKAFQVVKYFTYDSAIKSFIDSQRVWWQ